MAEVNLTFPDGAVKTYAAGTTPLEIANGIAKSLAKKAVTAKLNGNYVGMNDEVLEDGDFELVTKDQPEALQILRHSTSHLLAQALKRLYPNMHFGVGPAIENGFYYDTDKPDGQITVDQFPEIEKVMHQIVKENLPIVSREITRDEALDMFKDDPYKI